MISITALYFYPVKSCAGISVQSAKTDACGIVHDRAWSLLGSQGLVLTQRQFPRMTLIKPIPLEDGSLQLSAPGMSSIVVARPEKITSTRVKVWSSNCEAADQGDLAAQWLSEVL